jgi:hypothetical protein
VLGGCEGPGLPGLFVDADAAASKEVRHELQKRATEQEEPAETHQAIANTDLAVDALLLVDVVNDSREVLRENFQTRTPPTIVRKIPAPASHVLTLNINRPAVAATAH